MIWNESIECMERDNLHKIQSIRLKKIVEYVYHNTPFYRKKMQELGITPDDINGIEDISKLPFTTKLDLRDNYPFGLCAVPMSQIVRIHASSGTTGKPTVVGYTRKDLSTWAECLSRAFTAYGAGRSDIFQVSYGYGLFTGGLGAHAGAENIGASVIPMSSGNTEKQITLMHDFGSTVLCCTPSYALYLADAINDSGFPREEFKLKAGAFGAEPWTESMRKDIETKLGIKAYDIYGLSEIAGPGVGYECECQNGTHLNEDHFFPEIIDPHTLQPVEPGQTGELVFTHLTKEGMPLLRYRTKDLTALHYEKCSCGRTLVRMDRILGRSDDMLIIRGVNVFPTQIESVILEMAEFEPHYLLTIDRKNNTDTMELKVEVRPDYYSDEINKMLALKKKLTGRLQSVLGLGVDVKLVEPRSIERSVGKAKRVIDNRDLTALHYEKCSCGRTLVRMDRILGRSDDMLIIRGVNVFPTQIESVILEMAEFEPHYLLTIDRKNNTDTMELKVEVRPDYYSDEINKMLALKKKLTGRLQSVLGLGVDVKLVEPRSIERSVGKAKRVIDNRKL